MPLRALASPLSPSASTSSAKPPTTRSMLLILTPPHLLLIPTESTHLSKDEPFIWCGWYSMSLTLDYLFLISYQ
ncbi:unnamed protein product [Cuscuta europaea]|uniref:Uncharacterized protein n=1 Tax=Cuscuta europaea TaxID=41803 RepID=A0A9P1E822_CUSEU|nr:unnamed protein product [Cuscuta europaea]